MGKEGSMYGFNISDFVFEAVVQLRTLSTIRLGGPSTQIQTDQASNSARSERCGTWKSQVTLLRRKAVKCGSGQLCLGGSTLLGPRAALSVRINLEVP